MSKRTGLILGLAALLSLPASSALGATSPSLVEVGNVKFPDRSFALTTRSPVLLAPGAVRVLENGQPAEDVTVVLAQQAQKGKFGVVLVLDASASMSGPPLAGALAAARAFAERRAPNQELGLVAFNRRVITSLAPTSDAGSITKALASSPSLAVGTRIFDAVAQAISLLQESKVSVGSVVLLSDGRDTGSARRLGQVAKQARAAHVRIFTVGLHSHQYQPSTLQKLAGETGAAYAQAASPAALAPIYGGLSTQLSNEYLVQYKSLAGPNTIVKVKVRVRGFPGIAKASYRTPALPASVVPPFHRSFGERFWLSTGSMVVMSLFAGLLAGIALIWLLRGGRFSIRERMGQFVALAHTHRESRGNAQIFGVIERTLAGKTWWTKFATDLEIAEFRYSGPQLILITALTSIGLVFLVAVLALPSLLFLFALAVPPLVARALVKRKLAAKRAKFADQLPDNLTILASALRVGHSFVGALSVMVDEADEPSSSELRHALNDEQLGMAVEDALVTVAERMDNDDLHQIALVAALQRQTGGNTAEVLDTVVETIRERDDVRRLVKTLTAQGRAARWILVGLPLFLMAMIALINPGYLHPLFHEPAGQALLALAAVMVATGAIVIKRLIDIKV